MRTKTDITTEISGSNVRIGDRVKDSISVYQGIVISHTRHLTGCDRVWVRVEDPKVDAEKCQRCFDVNRVDVVERNPLHIEEIPSEIPAAG